MKPVELRSLTAELRIAASEDGTRRISGLIPYNSRSVDLGGFTEVIAPGAFAEALTANADVLALRDHDSKLLLGRTKSKTLALSDSPEGLRYTITLPKTTVAADLAESIDRGDLDSTSFGFRVIDDRWAQSNDEVVRTLLAVELMEVSPCSFPAYPASAVSVRSCPVELRDLLKRDDDSDMEDASLSDDVCPDCGADMDADGNCNCPDDETADDGDDSESDSIRHYIHMTLAIRERS